MVLPDTSIWVAFLRAGSQQVTTELHRRLDRAEVLACGPVVAELLAGARPADRKTLSSLLHALPWADLDREAWQSVGLLAADLRGRGLSLPLTDLEIAVAAHAAGAAVWTADTDFERITPLLNGLELRLAPT